MPPHTVVPADAIATLVALAQSAPSGAFAEVGVYKGGTAWHLAQVAREQGRALHLFDTFCGIPEAGLHDQQHEVGDFDAGGVETVRAAIPDAVFHVGVFPDTMPPDLGPLAFVHVDCDQYASICACIDQLMPLLVPGGIMLFDDYSHTSGARKAVDGRFRPAVEHDAAVKLYGEVRCCKPWCACVRYVEVLCDCDLPGWIPPLGVFRVTDQGKAWVVKDMVPMPAGVSVTTELRVAPKEWLDRNGHVLK